MHCMSEYSSQKTSHPKNSWFIDQYQKPQGLRKSSGHSLQKHTTWTRLAAHSHQAFVYGASVFPSSSISKAKLCSPQTTEECCFLTPTSTCISANYFYRHLLTAYLQQDTTNRNFFLPNDLSQHIYIA